MTTEPIWVKVDRHYDEYPLGTLAKESWNGSIWEKRPNGWKYLFGATFPRPATADMVSLPPMEDSEDDH